VRVNSKVRHDGSFGAWGVDDVVMPDHPAAPVPSDAELLAAVERSPAAARAHDRREWVGLFTEGGRIEDPVGSTPHRGREAIERFYDTFIGPRDITFHRDTDVVIGSTVVRDLELEVSMADTLVMRIPAYLAYDVEECHGGLKISRLQAYWELPEMMLKFALSGLVAVPAGLSLSRGLLRNQGAAGTVGFMSGFRRTGARGKRHLAAFLDDACAGDEVAVKRGVSDRMLITLGDDDRLGTSELVSRLAGGRPRKMISAGHTVAAGIESDGHRQILFADMRSGPLAITRIRLFSQVD
jgi:hypothetical protein